MNTNKSQTHNVFSRWIISHANAMKFAFNELIRTPIANFFTVCVIAIAIALPLGFFVILENLQYVDSVWDANAPTISLFLRTDTTQSQANTLIQQLQKNPAVKKVKYISPEAGLAAFQKATPFGDAASLFKKNPIPGVITIFTSSANQNLDGVKALYQSLKQLPSVDVAQIDMNWMTRLFDIIAIGKNITKALSLLFAFGVILIIGHALRASLSAHAKEVQVMKLVGATDGYIRRPLLYRGVLYGLLGGAFAWIITAIFLAQLQHPVSQLAKTYNTVFRLQDVSFFLGLIILFSSMLLGLISAWMITTQFLHQPEKTE